MINKSLTLITTSDENTWRDNNSVVFLGIWCCKYNREHVWKNMDFVISKPYGLGKETKDTDYNLAREFEEDLFKILSNSLNKYHKTEHGSRFWRILVGHWLHRYVNVMFNRIKTLEKTIKSYPISDTVVYCDKNFSLASNDSIEAIHSYDNNLWNNILYSRIIRLLGHTDISFEIIPRDNNIAKFSFNNRRNNTNPIKQIIKNNLFRLTKNLIRDNDAFILNTYLSKKEEIKLQMMLGQFPQYWTSYSSRVFEKPNKDIRKELTKQVIKNSNNNILNIMIEMLFEVLPVCYLEGFTSLKKTTEMLPWPKKPKFIFTSNSFANDEVFKFWTASKTESGSKYFAGQHGNNYATYRYLSPSIEEKTSDKFLTWGWTNCLPQHTPAFIFTNPIHKKNCYDPRGNILLVQVHLDHRFTIWDDTFEHNKYFEDQINFIKNLEVRLKQDLVIRLHAASNYLSWNEVDRFKKFDSSLKIDTGESNIKDLIAKSRLVVHSYDSTGILETLAQNIPSIAFFHNGLDHVNESEILYYQLLVDAGIFHLSYESASRKVNEICNDVDVWWKQSNIQSARMRFCDRFARQTINPISDLKNILEH